DVVQSQAPGHEGGHLAAGDQVGGTVFGVGGGVAAPGDAGGGQSVDVAFVDRARSVGELAVGAGCKVEGADQERGHLLAGDVVGGTVEGVGGRVASQGDAQRGDLFDSGLVD